MVAKPGTLQVTFNSGELAPELYSRNDIKQFYASAAIMRNAEPVPQGGFRLLDRSRDLGAERSGLIGLSGTFNIVGPGVQPGGTVVASLTFAAPVQLAVVRALWTGTISEPARMVVQYQDAADSVWKPLAAPYALRTTTQFRAAARPPGQPVTALGVRLLLNAGTGSGFTAAELYAFAETGTPVAAQYVPFSYSADETYMLVMTEGGIADVYRDGVFVGAAWHELLPDQVKTMVPVQRLETALLFHKDKRTRRIMRLVGGDHEWQDDDAPAEETPEVDLGGTYPKTDEVWQLTLRWPTGSTAEGYALTVSVDGEDSSVTIVPTAGGGGADWGPFIIDLKGKLEALATVAPGITLTDLGGNATLKIIELKFTGDGNSGSQFVVSARFVNTAEGGASALRILKGDAGGEPLFSPSRGYSRAGIFYQDRLVQGGFKAKPGAMLASPNGDYFNGNIDIEAASGGILVNLDTDGAETIQRFARSKHLVIFTSDAEYFVADRVLNRTQPTNIVESSRNGSCPTVPICSTEDSLLYVSKTRSLVYTASYDDVKQAYVSEPLSLLAKHLIKKVNGATLQRANDENDAARYFLVRDDGVMPTGLLIQSQEVTAFVQWVTDGAVRAAAVDGQNRVYLSVERMIGGVPRRRVEWLEPGLLVDGAVTQTFGTPQTVIGNLAMHEGATVWAIADGYALGPYTVAAGAITLPLPASEVTVGRWTPPLVRTLPLPRQVGDRIVVQRPCRVFAVKFKLLNTTSIAIGANGEPPADFPLYAYGMPVDVPQPPVSGWYEIDGLDGWTEDGQAEITQVRPGALQVAAVVIEAKT